MAELEILNNMRRLFAFCFTLCFALFSMAETVFTFTSAADMNQTKDGITINIAQGSGSTAPDYKVSWNTEYQPSDMRLYLGNTITISSAEALQNIQMVFAKSCASNKEYAGLSASTGTLVSGGTSESWSDWKVDSWSGSATQVVFTLTGKGQRQIQKIVIDGEPVVIDTVVPEPLPTAEDLDPNYVYPEPTSVAPQDTTVLKKEYAFIDHNILVYCTQGSIIKATDTTDAYFNCNANYTLTFTATQPIKGVEIDGFVRKAFNASCDHGTIQYLTDVDYDMEGWPAMVLLDVNSTSVTLSCPKQLRCYGVRVYFQENPDPLFPVEGIEPVKPATVSYKMLRDGQLIILRNGKTYDATGKEMGQ